MIIYGTGGSELGTKNLDHEKCPSCGKKGQLHLKGLSRYFSIFWIPVFPFSKKLQTFCNSCNKEIPKKQYTRELKTRIESEKPNFNIPISNFAGIILISLFAVWAVYQSNRHNTEVKNRIENLQKDDILVLKVSKEYYFLKVEANVNNTIYFKNSNYSLERKPYLSDYSDGLKKADFMDTVTYLFPQVEIDSIYALGDLDILD